MEAFEVFIAFAAANGCVRLVSPQLVQVARWDGRRRMGPRGDIDQVNARIRDERPEGGSRARTRANAIPEGSTRNRRSAINLNDIICFKCGKPLHFAHKCPSNVT